MQTIDEVCIVNLSTGEQWRTHDIAEEHGGRIAVLVGERQPELSFFGPGDRYLVRGRVDNRVFESAQLDLDESDSEESVEFVFRNAADSGG
jgi:hypothetical protein